MPEPGPLRARRSTERLCNLKRSGHAGRAAALRRIPHFPAPPLPTEWLRREMMERSILLDHAMDLEGRRIVEVGSGSHALATVPLAHAVGRRGRVFALEIARWTNFGAVVSASGVSQRIDPIKCDAQRMPLRSDSADLSVCLHGIRSLRSEATMLRVFREMLRVAPIILLAESLPIWRTEAQRAHLAMYDLREEVFRASRGVPDDLHYLPRDRLIHLVEKAGGVVSESSVVEVDLPHALAYFPRTLIESVRDPTARERLLARWDAAYAMLREFGEGHPPIAVISAHRG